MRVDRGVLKGLIQLIIDPVLRTKESEWNLIDAATEIAFRATLPNLTHVLRRVGSGTDGFGVPILVRTTEGKSVRPSLLECSALHSTRVAPKEGS